MLQNHDSENIRNRATNIKVKKDVKTKSFFNKITSGTKNIYEKIKKSIVGDEKKNSKKSKTTKSIKKGKTLKTLKK